MAKTRYSLMQSCAQAEQFARTFRGAANLEQEVEALHKECIGTVTLKSAGMTVICNCACHRKSQSKE